MWKRFVNWLLDRPLPPPTYQELLQQMDALAVAITHCEVKIRALRGKNERRYWEAKWEECVVLHMEFEWLFHPQNPEKFDEHLPHRS